MGVIGLVTLRGEAAAVRQLVLSWFAGSMVMGSVAALFLLLRSVRGGPGIAGVEPLGGLPVVARVVIILLVLQLFVLLAAIAWDTPGASFLPSDVRGSGWWAMLTWAFGLMAWVFAASVTFAANFPAGWQAALAYTCGGLPFALVAGLLQRSWLVNLAAGGISLWLVAAGLVIVADHTAGGQNALGLCLSCFGYLFGAPPVTG